jgi:hypothetical protein
MLSMKAFVISNKRNKIPSLLDVANELKRVAAEVGNGCTSAEQESLDSALEHVRKREVGDVHIGLVDGH